jgi:hypothetical protein
MRNLIVNEYTVGGSLLLVGFGFFSTRFADILSYQVTTIPSAIPVVGGASVTVGRILGVVPATLGLAVLMGKFRKTPVLGELTKLPVVSDAYDMVEERVSDIAGDFRDQIATSAQPTPEAVPMAAEEGGISDEDYAAEEMVINAMENAPKKTGTPKQQAWRSCVAESKGNMVKAKELYTAMGY